MHPALARNCRLRQALILPQTLWFNAYLSQPLRQAFGPLPFLLSPLSFLLSPLSFLLSPLPFLLSPLPFLLSLLLFPLRCFRRRGRYFASLIEVT